MYLFQKIWQALGVKMSGPQLSSQNRHLSFPKWQTQACQSQGEERGVSKEMRGATLYRRPARSPARTPGRPGRPPRSSNTTPSGKSQKTGAYHIQKNCRRNGGLEIANTHILFLGAPFLKKIRIPLVTKKLYTTLCNR